MNPGAYYEDERHWSGPPDAYQARLIEDLLASLPPGAGTALDAGCGAGHLLAALPATVRAVGVDRSVAALARCASPRCRADLVSLPFPDASFDEVFCVDALEHLGAAESALALAELSRVARGAVTLAVPLLEPLGAGIARCAGCGDRFHVNLHHRAFGAADLIELLPGPWRPVEIVFSGEEIPRREAALRLLAAALDLPARCERARCPRCGAPAAGAPPSAEETADLSLLLDGIPAAALDGLPDRSECFVRFERRARETGPAPDRFLVDGREAQPRFAAPARDGTAGSPRHALAWRSGGILFRLPRARCGPDGAPACPDWFRPGQILAQRAEREERLFAGRVALAALRGVAGAHRRLREAFAQAREDDAARREALRAERDAAREASAAESARRDGELARLRDAVAELSANRTESAARIAALEARADRADRVFAALSLRARLRRVAGLALRPFAALSRATGRLRARRGRALTREEHRAALLARTRPDLRLPGPGAGEAEGRTFLMLCHDQEIDRRILQEARALADEGYRGVIVAFSFGDDDALDRVDGVPVHRIGLKRIVPECPVYWRYQDRERRIRNFGWFMNRLSALNFRLYQAELRLAYGKSGMSHPLPFDRAFLEAGALYPARLVVAHDLPALAAAAGLAERFGAELWYDSHEMYSEMNMLTRAQRRILEAAEARDIRRCARVLTVSGPIAEALARKYAIARPAVIRNAGARVAPRPETRGKLREMAGIPPGERILLYHGGVVLDPNRNLGTLVRGHLAARVPGLHLVLMGPTEPGAREALLRLCGDAGRARVHLLDPVPREELVHVSAGADFAVIPYRPLRPDDLAGTGCLPNKFFEYVQAEIPILANASLREVARLLAECGGGICADLDGVDGVAEGIRRIASLDPAPFREALRGAKGRLSWEAEREAFLALLRAPETGGTLR